MRRFSIVLPTFNSGKYIEECVMSILLQTVGDFDLLVLDSGSSDTAFLDWIAGLNDERIRIYPATARLNIEQNWRRIIELPRNEFMTIIGHDDVLAPHYLEEMEKLIGAHRDASLYQTAYTFIDSTSKRLRDSQPVPETMASSLFLEYILKQKIDVNATGYMVRSKDYDAVGGIADYSNLLFADIELWIKLAGKSYLANSSRQCFCYREHASVSGTSSDLLYHKGIQRFVDFLASLEQQSESLRQVIEKYSPGFLLGYCMDFSHRLLNKTLSNRHHFTVSKLINDCRLFAGKLSPDTPFDPMKVPSIAAARWIDYTPPGRQLFLLFKKLYGRKQLVKRPDVFA